MELTIFNPREAEATTQIDDKIFKKTQKTTW